MMPPRHRDCPDCRVPLRQIRIIDKTHHHSHSALEYAAGDAERKLWIGPYPVEGALTGWMCDQCGRVQLYAQPKE
ncbi:MAG: hypothetical protein U1D55_00670 [Phycisphaerae bacterium]